jgi:UDP-N-acetylmuramyl pentapeptide phosphotransferase/UDP-N-acetylglucosamine-1-phosphate transferase
MPFLVSLGLALALVPAAVWAGRATGLVDRPSDPSLAIHARPVPLLGGVAVIGAALTSAALTGDGLPWSVTAATLVALATGLADDVRPLPPLVRLAIHAGAGAILAIDGLDVEPLGALGGVGVVLLVVACANAVNMIDGQNGLAGGLTAASAAGLALVHPAGSPARAIGFAFAAAAVAFLIWNVPGRIFLGNNGAYAAGALLAALAASATFQGWTGLLAAAACLGVFLFETLFTVGRRIVTGAGLMTGDRQHSYDIAARVTGSRLRSTFVFWVAGVAWAALGYAIARVSSAAGAAMFAAVAAAATVAGLRLWALRTTTVPARGEQR